MPAEIKNLRLIRIDLVDSGASFDSVTGQGAHVLLYKRADPAIKGEWTAAFINDLPDSSFAVVEAGGEKDEEGKTKPRSLRHLPYKDGQGKIDLPHLRNALSRLPQTNLSADLKEKARGKLEAAAREAGIGETAGKSLLIQTVCRVLKLGPEAIGKMEHAAVTFEQEIMREEIGARMRKLGDFWNALAHSVYETLESDAADKGAVIRQSLQQYAEAVKAEVAAILSEGAEKGAQDRLAAVDAAADGLLEILKVGETKMTTLDMSKLPKEAQEHIAGLQKQVADLEAAVKGQPAEQDALKGLSPEVRKMVEDAQKRATDAEATANAVKREQRRRDWVVKLQAHMAVPVNPEKDAEVFLALEDKAKDELPRVLELLKAADEIAQKSKMFSEIGRPGGDAGDHSALREMERNAEELRKQDPKLTKEQAITEVASRDPQLYERYRQEHPIQAPRR